MQSFYVCSLTLLMMFVGFILPGKPSYAQRAKMPKDAKAFDGPIVVERRKAANKKTGAARKRLPPAGAAPLPFTKEGPLEKIEEQVAQLVEIKMDRGRISANAKGSYEEIDPIVDQIREKLGYGGSSTSSGGSSFSFDFNTQKLSGRIQSSKVKKETQIQIRFTETVQQQRSLKLTASPAGKFHFTINGGSQPYLLRMRQSESGDILVQEIEGSQVYSCSAPDFETLLQVHSEFANNRLLPLMSRFGVGNLVTPYDIPVQKQVLASLTRMSQKEKDQFRQLAKNLDAQMYLDRKQASEKLKSGFGEHLDLFLKVLNEDEFSPEVRYRIQKLIQEKEKTDLLSTVKYVKKSGLTSNTEYLFWLLQKQEDPEKFDQVLGTIQKLTGLDSAEDPVAMQSWMAARQAAFHSLANVGGQTGEVAADPLKEKGGMDRGKEQMKHFLRLTLKDDNLAIDRDHFKKLFNGKSIRELSSEVDKLREKNNLPKSWYRAGGDNSISSSDYPQVHFELLGEKYNAHSERHYHYMDEGGRRNSSRNRTAESSYVRMKLLDYRRKSKKGNEPTFQFTIEEIRKPYRKLMITENPDGRVDVRMVSENSNVLLQLISDKEGVYVHDLRGSRVFAKTGKNLKELLNANQDYFSQNFFPFAEHLGLTIDPLLYGKQGKPEPVPSFWDLGE